MIEQEINHLHINFSYQSHHQHPLFFFHRSRPGLGVSLIFFCCPVQNKCFNIFGFGFFF